MSPQKCWRRPRGFGRGRLIAKLFSVGSTRRTSCVFAPDTASASGTPPPSVRRERLVPDLPRSVGFGPVFFPAERSLRHRSVEALPAPIDALQLVVLSKRFLPESEEHAPLCPVRKIPVERGRRTELARCRIPLAAGPQHEQNPVEYSTPVDSGSAPELADSVPRQKRLDAIPEFVRSTPLFMGSNTLGHGLTPRRGVRGSIDSTPSRSLA